MSGKFHEVKTESLPLGDNRKNFGVVGAIGVDTHARAARELPYAPGSKTAVTFNQIDEMKADPHVAIQGDHPALTALNFAAGYKKLNRPNEGAVKLHAPLAIKDTSSKRLREVVAEIGVDLVEQPYDGINPQSLVVVPESGDKVVLTAKPLETPAITTFDLSIDAIALASQGNWEGTFHNVVDFTGERVPRIIIGSESQIKQLDDPKKKAAYFRALEGAGGILCNDDEAALIVAAAGEHPEQDPLRLARQLQSVGGDIPIVSMSRGKDGAILLAGGDVHFLEVPPAQHVVNTVGAGDEFASVIAHGIRKNGIGADDIRTTMINAARAATGVIAVQDSLSGQMTREGLLPVYATNNGFRHEHYPSGRLPKAATIVDLKS